MTTEKMTVHKALCELKTLDSRIQKTISDGVFVFANKHSNNKVSGMSIGEYSAEVKAKYQSVCGLIARHDAIKRAVTLSNTSVKVAIGGKEYTVAEAIEMKTMATRWSSCSSRSWTATTERLAVLPMRTTANFWNGVLTSTSSLFMEMSI